MSKVNVVEKKVRVSVSDIIKYQLLTFCFFNGITLTKFDLDFLVELARAKVAELNTFCEKIGGIDKIFSSPQSARNAINKASIKKLVIKKGKNKKLLYINPEIKLQVEGNIMLDYKFLARDSEES